MLAPSGEISWALLMEYIEGPTLKELLEGPGSQFRTKKYNKQAFTEMCDIVRFYIISGFVTSRSVSSTNVPLKDFN